jgi:hypothetical protein
MIGSATFIAMEAMLRQGWVLMSFAEFEKDLELLEKKGLITPAEHNTLLTLAKELGLDHLPEA